VDYVPETEEIIDADEHVVIVLRISGRGAQSRVPVTQRVAIVYGFEEGRLARGKSFTSRAEALEVAGLLA
jgi:ketosteroid isomerase-like protein